ncbi:hypothetical protein COO60DRAFT_1701174 [Scenedesmus sp. NREL 46B-D3]|nr:hypothetical protein COO60DRAFT_1701174 [Scenedesmus sp. NREL 46B-D3]
MLPAHNARFIFAWHAGVHVLAGAHTCSCTQGRLQALPALPQPACSLWQWSLWRGLRSLRMVFAVGLLRLMHFTVALASSAGCRLGVMTMHGHGLIAGAYGPSIKPSTVMLERPCSQMPSMHVACRLPHRQGVLPTTLAKHAASCI